MTLMLRIAILVPIVAAISIFLSHRIAGPLFRIERFLKAVASGNFAARLKLRKRDELHDLAETINDMVGDLRNRVKIVKQLVNTARLELDSLKYSMEKEGLKVDTVYKSIGELTDNIKNLDDHLSQYRLETVED